MHLDGARLLNALIYSKDDPKEYCSYFDTVNFCFSKGMGCPIGSILLGSDEDIKLGKVMRKMLGGTMRQSGILAACMLTSMEDWKEKLTIDNENCYWLAN
jgi:threonine aldolase